MAPVIPHWAQPSHPNLIKVVVRPEAFTSGAFSLVALPAGSFFTRIDSATLAPKAYSSVQISRNEHIELNSDLIYCNHSCEPSLEFDMTKFEVRVGRNRNLKVGDALTFFYPSSEFQMAQSFQCECGAGDGICKGWISGASQMGRQAMEGYWLNEHIEALLLEKEALAENGHEQVVISNAEVHTLNGKLSEHGDENGLADRVEKALVEDGETLNGKTYSGPTSRELGGEMGGDTIYTVNKKNGASSRKLGGEMGGDTKHEMNGKNGASNWELGEKMGEDTISSTTPPHLLE
ncbi:hypothetical protein FGG08_001245 [Glutinoglossum americanum]|uniref:SET domain-containing protein n=1 Tax=Glutinoglossum americanum TaxID=1670608 RepID=A0A9P8IDT8_9PEZI|nr:hypothetical protein FGG08_001245 [Glutinoglossum americanum]